MGVVETIGAVAVAITTIITAALYAWKKAQAAKAQARADTLTEISLKLENAKTDEERIRYAKERADILNRK